MARPSSEISTAVLVPKDEQHALKLYKQAAELGYAPAQEMLGLLYFQGRGTQKDMPEAARWIHKAANQGFPLAENHLGFLYEHGFGVPQDLKESARWYRAAADHGVPEAIHNLEAVSGHLESQKRN